MADEVTTQQTVTTNSAQPVAPATTGQRGEDMHPSFGTATAALQPDATPRMVDIPSPPHPDPAPPIPDPGPNLPEPDPAPLPEPLRGVG